MAAWNDATFIAADWQSCVFLNMFDQAIWEREYGADLDPVHFPRPTFTGAFVVGDDEQNYSVVDVIALMQGRLAGTAGYFLQTSVDPTAYAASNAAGLLAGWETSGTTSANIFIAAGYSEGNWRRKLERRIGGFGGTNDTEGNIAAAGQVGWVYANLTAAQLALGNAYLGKYDGSVWQPPATWGATPTNRADLLASDQAAPASATASFCHRGDVMGEWCWRQMRDVANLMKRTTVYLTVASTTYYYGDNFDGGDATYAAALARAQAAFALTADPFQPIIGQVGSMGLSPLGDGQYYCYLSTGSQTYHNGSVAAHVPRTFKFYACIDNPRQNIDPSIYDAQTSGYAFESVVNWGNVGPTTTLTITSPQLLDASIQPPDFPPDVALPLTGFNPIGWSVLTINGGPPLGELCLVDWSFTYAA